MHVGVYTHTYTLVLTHTHIYCCSWCKNYSGKGGKASNVLFIFTCNANFHSWLVELLALSSLSLQHYKHGHQILVVQLQTAQVGVATTAAKQSNPVGLGNANWHHRTDQMDMVILGYLASPPSPPHQPTNLLRVRGGCLNETLKWLSLLPILM